MKHHMLWQSQSTIMIIPPYIGSDEVISQQGVHTARPLKHNRRYLSGSWMWATETILKAPPWAAVNQSHAQCQVPVSYHELCEFKGSVGSCKRWYPLPGQRRPGARDVNHRIRGLFATKCGHEWSERAHNIHTGNVHPIYKPLHRLPLATWPEVDDWHYPAGPYVL
jgi:hypothetical protein